MAVEWKSLLAQHGIPEAQWPSQVEERPVGPRNGAVVTFPSETPVARPNPETGQNEWNPDLREALRLIYGAYKGAWGKLSAPTWSRAGNSVLFHRV